MININRRGLQSIDTGRNASSIANSIVTIGPDDTLKAPDGYEQPSTSSRLSSESDSGDDCGCSTAESLSQAAGRHRGVGIPAGANPNNFSLRPDGKLKDSREPVPLDALGIGLWERLFCRQDSSGGSRRRNKLTILSAAMFLRSLGCSGRELARRLGMQSTEIQVDPRELQRRALSSLGGSASNLSSRDRDVINRKLLDTQGVDADRLRVSIDGQEQTISSVDYEGITSTANLINAVNGDTNIIEILDNEVEFAIIDTILENAIDQGLPNVIDLISNQISDPSYARKLYLNRVRQAALRSDLDTVKRIVELTDVISVLNAVPTIIKDIVASYKLPKGKDVASEYTRLIDLLETIDSDWYKSPRGSDEHINLSMFYNASDDAVLVLGQSNNLETTLHIRKSYPRLDINTLIARQHRRLVLRK